MVSIPGLGTPMQAAEFLLDAGLAIVPWDEEHLRISYANSYENLSIAMDRMERPCADASDSPSSPAGLPASQRPGGSSFPHSRKPGDRNILRPPGFLFLIGRLELVGEAHVHAMSRLMLRSADAVVEAERDVVLLHLKPERAVKRYAVHHPGLDRIGSRDARHPDLGLCLEITRSGHYGKNGLGFTFQPDDVSKSRLKLTPIGNVQISCVSRPTRNTS